MCVGEIGRVGNHMLEAAHDEGWDGEKDGDCLGKRIGKVRVPLDGDVNHHAAHDAEDEDGHRRIVEFGGDERLCRRLDLGVEPRHLDESGESDGANQIAG